MELRILCKHLVADELNGKFTVGENNADTVNITLPRFYEKHDLSQFSFRITAAGKCKNAAVQVLETDSFNEKNVYLLWNVTSDFTAIPDKFTLILTGVNSDNSVTIKFKSCPISVNPDKSWEFIPSPELSEQLLNQVQVKLKDTLDSVDEKISGYEISTATNEKIGGILSGNDISVSNDGMVTVNSVNGKTVAKSVPVNAVFTDTVYTLPKATTNDLGGVKIDGTTITTSSNGTISAKEVQNLAVQVAHPNNFLIYDDVGKPSVMVAIPKFYLDEVIDGASHTVHPAFIINGAVQDVIYISKYQNIVESGRAYSLPMKNPQTGVNFDQAYEYCKAKGAGWHLMTNAEWAAIALWCKKNGTMPKGNNYYGKDISESEFPNKAVTAAWYNNNTAKTATGSGPENWYHNGTYSGIADLNGNVVEWISGLRLNNGEIQVIPQNDAADWNNSCAANSTKWRAISQNGSLSAPGSENTFKFDYKSSITSPGGTSNCYLNTILEHPEENERTYGSIQFKSLTAKSGINIPQILKELAIFPDGSDGYGNDIFYFKNTNERMLMRGGGWYHDRGSGIFFSDFSFIRTASDSLRIGFRCAYYNADI